MLLTTKNTDSNFLRVLQGICGIKNVHPGSTNESYGKDEATKKNYSFQYLVKPSNEGEIAQIVKACNLYGIPLTPRGGGSGLAGGASPVKGGVVLSTERLNNIIRISTEDKFVIAESGVVTDELCKAIEVKNLYLPVRPSSAPVSFIGGNVASNCGSINSLKYGSIKDYVLNLQVVLPNGEIIWTGANTSKNSTGLNITQLFVGSEGILGIITKVVLKLISKPKYEYTLLAEFSTLDKLYNAIISVGSSVLEPSALELVDEFSSNLTTEFLSGTSSLERSFSKAMLLVNFDGNHQHLMEEKLEHCFHLIENLASGEVLIAKTEAEKEKLWKIRMNIGAALSYGNRIYRDIDIAVPVSKLLEFMSSIKRISNQFNIKVACFGHAGNGNLHTMISVDNLSDIENPNFIQAVDQIYKSGIEMGGTISGEHGVGILQKKYLPLQYNQAYLSLVKEIKRVFDPNNIINPGKILD